MQRASPAPLTYVAIGASDTVGEGASDPVTKCWPALLHRRLPRGSAYHNLGVGGSTVARAIEEQLPRARGHAADVLTVWLAVNDLNQGIAPHGYRDDLARLVDALLAGHPGRVFVGNVPDLTRVPYYERGGEGHGSSLTWLSRRSSQERSDDATEEPADLAARIVAYNDVIAALAAARAPRAVAVDLFTGSQDVIGKVAVVSADGLHPSDAGYELIAGRFAETMRAAGVPLE